jgi:hypothetical protein
MAGGNSPPRNWFSGGVASTRTASGGVKQGELPRPTPPALLVPPEKHLSDIEPSDGATGASSHSPRHSAFTPSPEKTPYQYPRPVAPRPSAKPQKATLAPSPHPLVLQHNPCPYPSAGGKLKPPAAMRAHISTTWTSGRTRGGCHQSRGAGARPLQLSRPHLPQWTPACQACRVHHHSRKTSITLKGWTEGLRWPIVGLTRPRGSSPPSQSPPGPAVQTSWASHGSGGSTGPECVAGGRRFWTAS